ncbi:nucleoporin Nup157/170 [Corynespora cassiicola Philippines]|uniref:Nucleoporin Nup157/170 n=1 Tax=Corynespora cassiicola Philippines TaxID=1448308 RepID=A0A2T2NVP9_CORCC|nr:nucleoporin Nup157/170 [Corynespora cassiicola Philippines]
MAFNMTPATPQRPTPGAFVNTPAPGRPAIFRSTSGPGQAPQPAPLVPSAPSETPIQRAARTVNAMLERDDRYPSLETYIAQGFSGEYDIPTSPAWTPFQKLKTYPVPEAVFEQVDRTQMSTRMGLFSEINHAWVAVDNQLYLWDYTHPNPELIGFEEQANTIQCVKLVRPRPNVFLASISYLLVVATTTDIFLIGVQCQQGAEGVHGVTLYRTGLSVSVRGISVGVIEGSPKTGRIFFAADNGSEDVYEINYQQEDRWFSSKCSKKNHVQKSVSLPALPFYATAKPPGIQQMVIDDTRNLLYTLSTNGTIKVYHMRTSSTLEMAVWRTLAHVKTQCGHITNGSRTLDDMKIVGIDPIISSEADHLSLLATTTTGCRLYFSTTSGGWKTDAMSPPSSMQVRHIRFPPLDGETALAEQTTSTQIQQYQGAPLVGFGSKFLTRTESACRYAPGSFFAFVRKRDDDRFHTLFMSAPHTGLLGQRHEAPRFSETGQIMDLRSDVLDVGRVSEPFAASSGPTGFGNELALQFDKPLNEFAILSAFGIDTVRRRRLVDIFAAIIKYGGGQEGMDGDVRKLVKQYGLSEIASTALAVACGQGSDVGPDSRIAKVTDPEVLEFARRAFIEYGGKPQLTETATVEGLNVDNVRASPRHDGIAMYVARLVRSIWDTPIIKQAMTATGPALESTHSVAKLQDIQRALVQLQEFLESNKSFIDGLAGPDALGRVASRQEEVELQGENRALTSLLQMINNIIEGIAFVLVLFEERLEDILVLLPEESRDNVRKLTYQGLFSVEKGKELAKELVKAIVNRNIAKGSNVETVAEALRRKCGSFCSSDDVVIFKAQENLQKAADAGVNAERGRSQLNDSLRLFEQVAKSLSSEHLTAAVEKYIALEFYAGAIRLSLKVAQELDRGDKALSWLKDEQPLPDARQEFFVKRTACYDHIFKVIEAVDRAASAQSPTQDGVISQISRRRFEAYEEINNSQDEVFQNYLYDWYLSRGWADRLLEINTPFVIEYLRRSSETDIAHADLLWRYYAHYNDYLGAADVQFQLAKSPFNLSLEKRIEYLSRAKANASTRMNGFSEAGVRNRQSRQELLREISDHLDIGNIQDDILQRIKDESRLTPQRKAEVVAILDGAILPLDELYHQYADQAAYYDICLMIYHAADYRNLPDIRHVWSNVIQQTHTDAVTSGHTAPWELVADKVEKIARAVGLNEHVFPPNTVLQMLLQYTIQYYNIDPRVAQSASDPTCSNTLWPIDTFIRINAALETVVSTLETIWYAQEKPFVGRANRKLLVRWIIYAVEQWLSISRRTGLPFGGQENVLGLDDLLRVVLGSNELGKETEDDRHWAERGRVIRQIVEDSLKEY